MGNRGGRQAEVIGPLLSWVTKSPVATGPCLAQLCPVSIALDSKRRACGGSPPHSAAGISAPLFSLFSFSWSFQTTRNRPSNAAARAGAGAGALELAELKGTKPPPRSSPTADFTTRVLRAHCGSCLGLVRIQQQCPVVPMPRLPCSRPRTCSVEALARPLAPELRLTRDIIWPAEPHLWLITPDSVNSLPSQLHHHLRHRLKSPPSSYVSMNSATQVLMAGCGTQNLESYRAFISLF